MNPSLGEEHGEIPRRGQSPVAGLAAELASCPHGILAARRRTPARYCPMSMLIVTP
jgi:hypothetical protein